jgi:hypothetical protein
VRLVGEPANFWLEITLMAGLLWLLLPATFPLWTVGRRIMSVSRFKREALVVDNA